MKTLLYSIKTLDYSHDTKDSKATKELNDSDVLYIEGFGSHVAKDRVKDIVLPEAFEKSLPTFKTNPVMLLNHNQGEAIGKWTEMKITEEGLYMKGFISKTRPDLQEMVREGIFQTLSIGYNPITAAYDSKLDANIISELELLEVSVVSVPCNPAALFMESDDTEMKNIDNYLKGYVLLEAISKQKTYNINKLLQIVSKELDLDEQLFSDLCIQLKDKENKMKNIETLVKNVMDEVSKVEKEIEAKSEEIKEETSEEVKEIETEKAEVVEEAKSADSVGELIELLKGLDTKLEDIKSLLTKSEEPSEAKEEVVEEVKAESKEEMEMEDEEEKEELEEDKGDKEEEKSEHMEEEEEEEDKEEKSEDESEKKEITESEAKELEALELEALRLVAELLEDELL